MAFLSNLLSPCNWKFHHEVKALYRTPPPPSTIPSIVPSLAASSKGLSHVHPSTNLRPHLPFAIIVPLHHCMDWSFPNATWSPSVHFHLLVVVATMMIWQWCWNCKRWDWISSRDWNRRHMKTRIIDCVFMSHPLLVLDICICMYWLQWVKWNFPSLQNFGREHFGVPMWRRCWGHIGRKRNCWKVVKESRRYDFEQWLGQAIFYLKFSRRKEKSGNASFSNRTLTGTWSYPSGAELCDVEEW